MTTALRDIKDEKTEHLLWFIQHGFHQMKNRREAAKQELETRGIKTSQYKHQCICNQCKDKQV